MHDFQEQFGTLFMQQCVCHYYFSFKQSKHNITTIRVRFHDIRNKRGLSIKVLSALAFGSADITHHKLDYSRFTKTSSSNCLILSAAILGVDPWEPQVFSQWHSQQMPHPPLKSYHLPSPWGKVGSDESPGHKVQYFKALPNCNKIFFLFY